MFWMEGLTCTKAWRQTTEAVWLAIPWTQAEDAALEGSGPGLGALQLRALHLDVSGGPAPRPPPRTCAGPLAPATSHPGCPNCPSGPVPCTAAGRPGRGGASRTDALGRAVPWSAPSGGAPAATRACAVGDTAVRAARARGPRERAGPGLRVRRDCAIPLLRRRVRGGRARLRPGAATPAPAAASAARAGARPALLPPDGLRGRSVVSGHAQSLPHGPRAVGARVRLRVTLPQPARRDGGHGPRPDGAHRPAWQAPRQTAHAQEMPSGAQDSPVNCTKIKCGKSSRGCDSALRLEGLRGGDAVSIGKRGTGTTCVMVGGSHLLWAGGKEGRPFSGAQKGKRG